MTPTTFTARLGKVLLYIEREMEGDADYESILREVEKRLEILRTDAIGPSQLQPAKQFHEVPRITMEDAAAWAANYYGHTVKKLATSSRAARITLVRHTVMWFLVTRLGCGVAHVGKLLNRDHSSVCHARKRIDRERNYSAAFKADTDDLLADFEASKGGRRSRECGGLESLDCVGPV